MSNDPPDHALLAIHNFVRISDRLGTAGQPTEEQISAVAAAGFETVVNLALPTSPNALPDEAAVVERAGMRYVHIPIDFDRPEVPSALRLFDLLRAHGDRRLFVHCAKNMRVSALVFAFRTVTTGGADADAARDLRRIWEPNETWRRYIDDVIAAAKR